MKKILFSFIFLLILLSANLIFTKSSLALRLCDICSPVVTSEACTAGDGTTGRRSGTYQRCTGSNGELDGNGKVIPGSSPECQSYNKPIVWEECVSNTPSTTVPKNPSTKLYYCATKGNDCIVKPDSVTNAVGYSNQTTCNTDCKASTPNTNVCATGTCVFASNCGASGSYVSNDIKCPGGNDICCTQICELGSCSSPGGGCKRYGAVWCVNGTCQVSGSSPACDHPTCLGKTIGDSCGDGEVTRTTTTRTTPPNNLPKCTVGNNGEKEGTCTACSQGGDDKCGTFQSTKSCNKSKIYIGSQLSTRCTPVTSNNTCDIADKKCVNQTLRCVNNQCINPEITPTPTPVPSTTTTGSSSTTTTLPTPTPTPPTCPTGQYYPYFTCKSFSCARVKACGVDDGICSQSGGLCGLSNGTYLSFIIGLDGLGSTGDNQNPNDVNCSNAKDPSKCGSNQDPNNSTREITTEFFDLSGSPVGTFSGEINYTTGATNSGKFTGAIDVTNKLAAGSYIVKVKSPGYLKKQLPGTTTVVLEQVNALPSVRLVTGNVNQDSSLDIQDYNILMSCSIYGSDNKVACNQNSSYALKSDLEDNGAINEFDYLLLMREWINQIEQ